MICVGAAGIENLKTPIARLESLCQEQEKKMQT
jgi:hypothetical protein